jgi:hypothetical protein
MADQFTHCTQDEDHGVPTSPRISVRLMLWWVVLAHLVPIPGPYTYHILDIHSQQSTRWVYEWVDPELYNMCYQDWHSTAEWTNFTWQEHKAHLL